MSIPFSRSVRALNIDSYRASLIGIEFAVVLMIVLLGWFFTGKVTIYEMSTDLQYTNGRVVAKFQHNAIQRIYPGQAAILRVETGEEKRLITLPAIVIGVNARDETVEVIPVEDEIPRQTDSQTLTGQVQIEVEYLSPAALIRRSSGMYLQESQFPVSPQRSK